MTISDHCPLASVLAERLRAEREELVRRWLGRIVDRVALHPNHIFPTDQLLDHVPLLIDGIADYLEDPDEEITADVPVIAKAMELGELRHTQGFSAHEILKEYEILGGVLFAFLTRIVDEIQQPCTRGELLACTHRLFRALSVIQQVTTDQYMHLATLQVREREDRLRAFNRSVTHELKNRLGAADGAVRMLHEAWILRDEAQARRFVSIAERNLAGMQGVLDNLIELSRLDATVVRERNVVLPEAAAEVKRQLRDFANARQVRVEIADNLPYVEVPAAAVELALSNFLSNAIKYRDPGQQACWARVEGELRGEGDDCEVVVRVRDNGLGVPEQARGQLFQRSFRAHQTVTREEGTGMGLSIVRETITTRGGSVWAEFPEQGSVFSFAVPCLLRNSEP